jgi:hypothetical protein
VPKGDTPGEWYSPTEPFPLKPPPLSRMTMTKDDVSKRTPEAEKFCGEWFSRLRSEGAIYALRHYPLVVDAGNHGRRKLGRRLLRSGDLGYIFVNTSSLGTVGQMAPTAAGSLCPITTWAGTLASSIRRDTHANSPPGANWSR